MLKSRETQGWVALHEFGFVLSLLHYGQGLSHQAALAKTVYISFLDRLVCFPIHSSQAAVLNNACLVWRFNMCITRALFLQQKKKKLFSELAASLFHHTHLKIKESLRLRLCFETGSEFLTIRRSRNKTLELTVQAICNNKYVVQFTKQSKYRCTVIFYIHSFFRYDIYVGFNCNIAQQDFVLFFT